MIARYGFQARYGLAAGSSAAGPANLRLQRKLRTAGHPVSRGQSRWLNGREAELVVGDDKLNPGEAATRTLEFVEREKVTFVVGSLSAAVRLAARRASRSGSRDDWRTADAGDRAGDDPKPDLIMLDEPSEEIMPVLVDEMIELFRTMKAQGTTVLLVEQNVELTLDIADRACVLDWGAMVYHAAASELLADNEIRYRSV
jgi:ABC-type thiamine transport system ATPase subunit